MTGLTRLAIVGCWLVFAIVLLRALVNGSIDGIAQITEANEPAVLLGSAVTIAGAGAAAGLLLAGATSRGLSISIVIGVLAVPFALAVWIGGHESAWVMCLAALVALALSAKARLDAAARPTSPL